MNQKKTKWSVQYLPTWAVLFFVFDFVLILFLQITNYFIASGAVNRGNALWGLNELVMVSWRKVHFPLNRLLEPLFFPMHVTDPSQISHLSIFAFQLSCTLQSISFGLLVGICLCKLHRLFND